MPFEQIPYTNFHGTNQDWMIQQIKQMIADWATYRENLDAAWADYQENINNWRQALDAAFAELHTYVHDYFDNLDVQQEINNKLDQMKEDGAFDEILLPYFNEYTITINNRMATQDTKITSLENRVDNFLNNTGSLGTQKDPELIDVRVGGDGITYASAGDAVRGQYEDLAPFNAARMIKKIAHTSKTDNGITYSWSGNVCTVSGQATAASTNNIINSGVPSDYGFEIGKTYYVIYKATAVRLRVYCRVNGTNTEILNTFKDGSFTIPEGTSDMTIRLTVANGTDVTPAETLEPIILTAPTNNTIYNSIGDISAKVNTMYRTGEGVTMPVVASWKVQLTDGKFALADMPRNTIAYTLFSSINDSDVANFPIKDLNAIYIEKIGRESFQFYKIYANDRENTAIGFYINNEYHWYADQCIKTLRIGMLGDSVTQGRVGGTSTTTNKGIPYWVNYETGLPVTNLGVGSQGWISKQYLDQNAEEYIQTLDLSNYDVLTFMYGANDGDVNLGTYEDTTEQTIMGAMYRCVNYAMTQNPNLRIIMIEHPIGSRSEFPYYNPNAQHSAPDHWRFTQYFEQMKLFCEKYALPLIEGWRALNAWNRATYIGDNIHPTVEGYQVVGQYIAGQIKSCL